MIIPQNFDNDSDLASLDPARYKLANAKAQADEELAERQARVTPPPSAIDEWNAWWQERQARYDALHGTVADDFRDERLLKAVLDYTSVFRWESPTAEGLRGFLRGRLAETQAKNAPVREQLRAIYAETFHGGKGHDHQRAD